MEMKKSLGRRSSSRNPTKAFITEFESSRKDRRSGIPVRAASFDRNLNTLVTPLNRGMVTPSTKRSVSEDRNSMIFSARSGAYGGTERPSRATTLSTNSGRHSSFGGARSKRDNRPIEDREWQSATQKKVEDFLEKDPEGCHILSNGSIKPMTLNLFISIIDLLLRRLYGNNERNFINKCNYITEFPFYMKNLFYRGKIEKSWLISVNTTRSWCHVLASIDFLVTCVNSQTVIDPSALLFPEKYDTEDDDLWNYQIVLPYLQKSYELYKMDDPHYDSIQAELDKELIQQHISNDNAFERIEVYQSDILKIKQESERMANKLEKCTNSLKELDGIFNDLKDNKSKYEEYIEELERDVDELKIKSENMEKYIERLNEDLEKKKHLKTELEKDVANQQISTVQLAELRQKRDSLQREIERENEYVSGFEDLIRKSGLEILSKKKQIHDLLKSYNMEIIKYFSYGLEKAMIDPKQSEEEITHILDITMSMISSAKLELQTLAQSASHLNVSHAQAREEVKSWENQVYKKKETLDQLIENNSCLYKKTEELVNNFKYKLESITKQIDEISNNSFQEQEAIIQEKEARAEKMEKQLSEYRTNAVYSTTKCTKLLEEYIKKNQLLDEDFAKQLEISKKRLLKL